jgi:hypothetical protein
VSQKQFMRPLMMAAGVSYAFRIGSSSTVGVEGHAPTELDWLFALYCLSLQEAQAGVDVLSGARGRQGHP